MKLAFKRFGFGYVEKEVPVILKIGTLEDVCSDLNIEFWQISETIKKDNYDFMSTLLFQGYITACKESFKKPKYDRVKSFIWFGHLSKESEKELMSRMQTLIGDMKKMSKPDKKKVKSHGVNSKVLPSEN
jgi:hypothetical protein